MSNCGCITSLHPLEYHLATSVLRDMIKGTLFMMYTCPHRRVFAVCLERHHLMVLCPNYNKEVKRLKVKVRKMYNKRKFGQPHQRELNRLFKELLVAKKRAQETFLLSVLQNEGRCWTEFYM